MRGIAQQATNDFADERPNVPNLPFTSVALLLSAPCRWHTDISFLLSDIEAIASELSILIEGQDEERGSRATSQRERHEKEGAKEVAAEMHARTTPKILELLCFAVLDLSFVVLPAKLSSPFALPLAVLLLFIIDCCSI